MLSSTRIVTLVSCMVVIGGAELNGTAVAQQAGSCQMPGDGYLICTETVSACTPYGVMTYCESAAASYGWESQGYSCSAGGTAMMCIWYIP